VERYSCYIISGVIKLLNLFSENLKYAMFSLAIKCERFFLELGRYSKKILPTSTEECKYEVCAGQTSLSLTKFIINSTNIYVFSKVYYKNGS
jgi:hypothetical protein